MILVTYGRDPSFNLSEQQEAFLVYKKPMPTQFEIAKVSQEVQTLEGKVCCAAGDAIMRGEKGEQWPIPKTKFEATYDIIDSNTAIKKKLLVYAMQIKHEFKVVVSWSDAELSGKAGDYLVEYSPCDFGVVDQEIFHLTYELSER